VSDINKEPFVLNETDDFAVVYKPPRMHSAPLPKSEGDTLADWYAQGKLLHRLDFETHGLVLFAKNQKSLDFLLMQQEQGNFVKEYSAICQKSGADLASFPPPPCRFRPDVSPEIAGTIIESFFRPFGPGRKQVRPVTDAGGKNKEVTDGCYRTEIVNVTANGNYTFTIRLTKGFRHQIRCHLAWIGCPVANDPLYGEQSVNGFLALRAHGLFFPDPASGKQREYRIEPLFTHPSP